MALFIQIARQSVRNIKLTFGFQNANLIEALFSVKVIIRSLWMDLQLTFVNIAGLERAY